MSTWAHLLRLLRGRWFRRLLAVRLSSQLADGVFQVALASYALFSDRQPSAAALAAALAVVTLPFSLLGPFAGVLLDRWSRRQVLVWGNLVRVGLALATAGVVAAGLPDPVFYGVVLACLSVNRFLLAGLSAALPHTVTGADLVTANALSPTAGTLAFVAGLGVGGLVRGVGGAGSGDVAVLLTAAVLYAGAGSLALRIPRSLLGPDLAGDPPPALAAVREVGAGLLAGLHHLRERRAAAVALGVIGSHRYWFGLWTVAVLLLHRNLLHPGDPDSAFAALGLVAATSAAGFVTAALVTPSATERFGTGPWVLGLLVVAAAVQLPQVVAGTGAADEAALAAAYALGLVSQGVKICVDTVVQAGVDDDYRGRVFSLYDVGFNVAFVAAAATAAAVLPLEGRSPALAALAVAGYLVTATGWWVLGRSSDGPPSGLTPPLPAARSRRPARGSRAGPPG
jgi:MFS family permease